MTKDAVHGALDMSSKADLTLYVAMRATRV